MKSPQEKADFIRRKNADLFDLSFAQAADLVRGSAPLNERGKRVIEIADALGAKVYPYSACRAGCSHCCYQTVVINSWEAERIGRAIGRAPADVEGIGPGVDVAAVRAKYAGQACPLLKDGRCSVYEVRPLACRTLYSLESTPDPCDIRKHKGGKVAWFNFTDLTFRISALFAFAGTKLADLRDFFPEQP